MACQSIECTIVGGLLSVLRGGNIAVGIAIIRGMVVIIVIVIGIGIDSDSGIGIVGIHITLLLGGCKYLQTRSYGICGIYEYKIE